MKHELIYKAFIKADISKKQYNLIIDPECSDVVVLNIRGVTTKWTDNEKGYIAKEMLKYFNGTLDDCLDYLQGFQRTTNEFKGMDLNEIKHTMELNYE